MLEKIVIRFGWLLLALGLTMPVASDARAAHPHKCFPYEKYVNTVLKGAFKEASRGEGMLSQRFTGELFVSEGGETWTFLATDQISRVTCVMVFGTDWEEVPGLYGQQAELR